MSCNYADGLSPYHDKGQLGLEERFDSKSVVAAKVALLTKWINEARHVVVHTGAGISTSAGVPDFRGPRGVWTLQAKGEKPDLSTDFNDALPTITHMAITKLVERGKVKYVVSQNIDGLHLRSNLPRKYLSELHGNVFTEQCNACGRRFVRNSAVPTVGQKSLNKPCPALKANGRPCRGRLHDTILDWEHNLPENDLGMADYHSCMADLSLCLGTTMQIVPSGNLPLYTKKLGGKLVICNLQPTKHNRKADLIIHAYVDDMMTMLMKNLNLKIPKYSFKNDPTKFLAQSQEKYLEWTISDYALKRMKKIYEEKCGTKEARKRLEMIDDDLPLSVAKNLKRTRVKDNDEDSDLEVLDVIVKPKRNSRETSRRGQKKNSTATYNSTITVKKVTPPPKKGKYETEKITIKKNVTPTKTKYEIVQPKPKKAPKCEIVYSTDSDVCNDLDMICESDDDEMTNNYTYNFRLYLYDEKEPKKEEEEDDKKNVDKIEIDDSGNNDVKNEEENGKKLPKVEGEEGNVSENDSAAKECDSEVKNEEKEERNADENVEKKEDGNSDGVENVEEEKKKGDEEEEEEEVEEEEVEEEEEEEEEESLPKEDEKGERDKVDKGGEVPAEEAVAKPEEKKEGERGKTPEEELADYIKSAEMEVEKDEKLKEEFEEVVKVQPDEGRKIDEGRTNEEKEGKELDGNVSDFSNLSNSNVESTIDELVNERASSQLESMQECNENYRFYNSEYTSSGNIPELEYVDNNYYNNF